LLARNCCPNPSVPPLFLKGPSPLRNALYRGFSRERVSVSVLKGDAGIPETGLRKRLHIGGTGVFMGVDAYRIAVRDAWGLGRGAAPGGPNAADEMSACVPKFTPGGIGGTAARKSARQRKAKAKVAAPALRHRQKRAVEHRPQEVARSPTAPALLVPADLSKSTAGHARRSERKEDRIRGSARRAAAPSP